MFAKCPKLASIQLIYIHEQEKHDIPPIKGSKYRLFFAFKDSDN